MKIEDLGELSGPVLVYGGPYSNLQASEALLSENADIAPENRICTGDVIAYCGDPVATLALIRRAGGTVVAGNCEKQLGEGADDCGCGFEPGSTCDILARGWYAHARSRMDAPARRWMRALPDLVTFRHQGLRHIVLHGGVSDISRFIWPVSPSAVFHEEIALIHDLVGRVDRVIAGHSGLPFRRQVGDVEWINAGVIGMPPNRGSRNTHYLRLEDFGPDIVSLDYDARAAARRMIDVGLTEGYEQALLSGDWPSEEVLPASLRRS